MDYNAYNSSQYFRKDLTPEQLQIAKKANQGSEGVPIWALNMHLRLPEYIPFTKNNKNSSGYGYRGLPGELPQSKPFLWNNKAQSLSTDLRLFNNGQYIGNLTSTQMTTRYEGFGQTIMLSPNEALPRC